MPTALAISPHLDDAVFSAGGMLSRLAGNGWRVIVATVFTASVRDPQGFALACQLDKGLAADVDYMALRRREDAVACAAIGAEPRWLPFVEAPHRGYHSADRLFAGLRPDDAIVETIAPAIRALLRNVRPDAVFSPQAIGAHVDHVAVYLALRTCDVPRWLWADFPYVAHSPWRVSPFVEECVGLSTRDAELTLQETEAKTAAALAYTSQIGFQFGSARAATIAIGDGGRRETYMSRCDLPA